MSTKVSGELLDTLAADLDDVVPWSIYSDLLQTNGDPRGELMSTMIGRERHPTQQLLEMQRRTIAKHGAAMVPAALADHAASLVWRRGFVSELRLEAPEELELLADPTLRFVDAVTLVIDCEQWDEWCDALASRPRSWRRIRVELDNAPGSLRLEPLLQSCPAVETLRIAGPEEVVALRWDGVRAPRLQFVTLVNAGEVDRFDVTPQLRELRLLGLSTATAALGESPLVRVGDPIERDVDRESNAFVVIDQPIELAVIQKLVGRMSGIHQMSMRLAHMSWLPRPISVMQLYGSADADLPYGLAVALDAVLKPPPRIALVEVDEVHGRYLVLDKAPCRAELAPSEELVRRAIDLAVGRDPGPGILEEIDGELAVAPMHALVGDGYVHTLLNVIDPVAAPLIEPEDEDENEYDDDDDYGERDEYEGPWDANDHATYEEPVLVVEERVAEVLANPEPDQPPPDEDHEPFEIPEDEVLEHPEAWFEFRDHWQDRAVDPDDEPGEQRWPDPEHVANEAELDLDRQVSEPACIVHGAVLEHCRWCDVAFCGECHPPVLNAPEGACSSCAANVDLPLPPPVSRRQRVRELTPR